MAEQTHGHMAPGFRNGNCAGTAGPEGSTPDWTGGSKPAGGPAPGRQPEGSREHTHGSSCTGQSWPAATGSSTYDDYYYRVLRAWTT